MFFWKVRRTKELSLTLRDPPLMRALISLFPIELENILPGMQAGSFWTGAQHRHPESSCSGGSHCTSSALCSPSLPFLSIHILRQGLQLWNLCEPNHLDNEPVSRIQRTFENGFEKSDFLNIGCSKNTNKNFGKQLLQLFKSRSKLASPDFFERNLLPILLKSLLPWRRGRQRKGSVCHCECDLALMSLTDSPTAHSCSALTFCLGCCSYLLSAGHLLKG